MPIFNDFLSSLKKDLLDFAEKNINEYKDELLKDGNSFLKKTRKDLKRWTAGLTVGLLSKDDFEFLVKGKKDLAEMIALKQKGLAKVRLNKLRDGMIEIIIGSAFKSFL
ncbi:MAG: hypothetical protein KJN64_02360 [Ignavibacteria bacterium]|nr:hypothetical protein [Ignavibacteria bacterium]MBT8381454.1 hypothetical protein [Ignavibacteria bacterium]MBT8391516.1 hypothetical protein [Ignavibacteria bacterium]NNJ52208.1 hypothetical protein [Ignavibacteriaceae bacterium]NNL22684.1 hypothetical protein [Ignavibacteriaceae bacterium]